MTQQLDMFGTLFPPPPPKVYIPKPRRTVLTRAYGAEGHPIEIYEDSPEPFEMEVRGIPCLVVCAFGLSTYAIEKPGSPFWSETGFRSMSTRGLIDGEPPDYEHARATVTRLVEDYIDRPRKGDGSGGLGGKLTKWWPGYVLDWQHAVRWDYEMDRSKTWDQWGPERHAEIWAKHDRKRDAALARMSAEGIDPNEVGPPERYKGPWPDF